MGSSGANAIIVIAVILALLLFSSQIMAAIGEFIPALQEWIEKIIGTFPHGGGNVTGYTWIGYTVYYTDGTSEDIRQTRPTLSLFPLSITFSGKDIMKFRVDVKAELQGENMGAWDSSTTLRMEAYRKPDTVPKTSSTGTYTKNGASWSNMEIKILASTTVEASTLEQAVATYGDGAWLLQWLGTVDLSVTVSGVKVDLQSSNPAGGMDFTYSNGVPTGLSIYGDSEPLAG